MTDFHRSHYRNVSTDPLGIGRGLLGIRKAHFGDHWAMLLHVCTGSRLRTQINSYGVDSSLLEYEATTIDKWLM